MNEEVTVDEASGEEAPVEAELPEPSRRIAILEALLFVSPGPMRLGELAEVCGWGRDLVERDLERLAQVLEGRGIELQRVAGAVRLVTVPEAAASVERMLKIQSRRRLTRAQLETLAVVAYQQPVTRAQVETYRGVKCERALSQLMELRLIREVGRAPLPGRPCQYGTSAEFLRHFGLNDLTGLPAVEGQPGDQARSKGPFASLTRERPEASFENPVAFGADSGEREAPSFHRRPLEDEGGALMDSLQEPPDFSQRNATGEAVEGGAQEPGRPARSHLDSPSAELRKLFERIRRKSPEP